MRRTKYFVLPVALAVVVILNLPLPICVRIKSVARDGFAPFRDSLSLVIRRVRNVFSYIGYAAEGANEREMQIELAGLRDRVRQLERFERENRQLRKQLGFSLLSPRRLLLCEVVGCGDMTGWWNVLRLNKGKADGVVEGAPVVTVDGLLGRTISVSEHGCDVLLITDPNFKVSCRIERTDTLGIARGDGVALAGKTRLDMVAAAMPCRMDFVSRSYLLEEGDRVVTSGLGGGFPEGMPVGRVHSARADKSGLYQEVKVVPLADTALAKYVFVVLEDGNELELRDVGTVE